MKVLMAFSAEMKKPVLKFTWNCNGFQMVKTILKKDEVGKFKPPDFKIH